MRTDFVGSFKPTTADVEIYKSLGSGEYLAGYVLVMHILTFLSLQ